jgi:hypothetical protein
MLAGADHGAGLALRSAGGIAASTTVVIPIRAVSDDTERLIKPTTYRKYSGR